MDVSCQIGSFFLNVVYVSTTTYASLYPNCVPINPFGPSSIAGTQYNSFSVHTKAVTTNIMDNVGGSVSGNIFDLPAGAVKAALSAESRWVSYGVVSNAQPGFVNCAAVPLLHRRPALGIWIEGFSQSPERKCYGGGREVNFPLLRRAACSGAIA